MAADESAVALVVNGERFSVTLEGTEVARVLASRLPLTLSMDELNGNEKYCYLDEPLPTDPEAPGQIQAGDLMLFGSDCLVLFYQSFSAGYRYTRIGRLEDAADLAEAVGEGAVEVQIG